MDMAANREDDDLIPLSALQHYLYCPRQCALIHLERQWAENRFTAEGRLLHARTDGGGREKRGAVSIVRAMPLRCDRLGLVGVADVVEWRGKEKQPFPVEYKRGKPKAHRADEVQLCAQALCLEEMVGRPVPEGALFYGEPRKRTPVVFDDPLRRLTEQTAAAVRAMYASGATPPPAYAARKCGACSLIDVCRPQRLSRPPDVAAWLTAQLIELSGD